MPEIVFDPSFGGVRLPFDEIEHAQAHGQEGRILRPGRRTTRHKRKGRGREGETSAVHEFKHDKYSQCPIVDGETYKLNKGSMTVRIGYDRRGLDDYLENIR